MAIGFTEARRMAAEAIADYREGFGSSIIKYQMRLKHPNANGFEVNRAYARMLAIANLEDLIWAGTPPVTVTLPYPLPPSSMGPGSPPNLVIIMATLEMAKTGQPNFFRVAAPENVNKTTYAQYLLDYADIAAAWIGESDGEYVGIADPAIFII